PSGGMPTIVKVVRNGKQINGLPSAHSADSGFGEGRLAEHSDGKMWKKPHSLCEIATSVLINSRPRWPWIRPRARWRRPSPPAR
ncbi:hypothetical protein THAOC_15980, partial [Thalassiosira oceanica]